MTEEHRERTADARLEAEEIGWDDLLAALEWLRRQAGTPYEMCRHPEQCSQRGYCTRDPSCDD